MQRNGHRGWSKRKLGAGGGVGGNQGRPVAGMGFGGPWEDNGSHGGGGPTIWARDHVDGSAEFWEFWADARDLPPPPAIYKKLPGQ